MPALRSTALATLGGLLHPRVMAWLMVVCAGLLETGFAVCLKKSESFSRFWPTVGSR